MTKDATIKKWYWVKIKGEWQFPATRDRLAVGGWTNLDTWEDFNHEVDDFIEILPPPGVCYDE